MPSVPLFCLVVFVLAILVIRVARSRGEIGGVKPFLPFLIGCTLQAIIVGLRWSEGFAAARFIQPFTASMLPGLAWLGFVALRDGKPITARLIGYHLAPVLLVGLLTCSWRAPLDFVIAGLFIGYGIALMRGDWRDVEHLPAIRIGEEALARRTARLAGGSLIASGLLDLVIAFDFASTQGAHIVLLVTTAQLSVLMLVGLTATVADRLQPSSDVAPEASDLDDGPPSSSMFQGDPSPEDRSTIATVEAALRDRKLYRDPDLTLNRLARRVGLPARQISAALNRSHGQNVSQVVNAHRVAEARRLLTETDRPVGEIMFEAGFQTKSNFNREFKRIVGRAPSHYRRGTAQEAPVAPAIEKVDGVSP